MPIYVLNHDDFATLVRGKEVAGAGIRLTLAHDIGFGFMLSEVEKALRESAHVALDADMEAKRSPPDAVPTYTSSGGS